MKQRVEEMEREAKKLRELQAAAEKAANGSEGGENGPMEAEEDKTAIDSRSVYVGNVCLLAALPSPDTQFLTFRWITVPLQRKYKVTSNHAVPLIGSLFFATSSLAIQRGGSHSTMSNSALFSFLGIRYAYVEFAEPEHIDAALTMDNSLFRGRLIKVPEDLDNLDFFFSDSDLGDGEADQRSEV